MDAQPASTEGGRPDLVDDLSRWGFVLLGAAGVLFLVGALPRNPFDGVNVALVVLASLSFAFSILVAVMVVQPLSRNAPEGAGSASLALGVLSVLVGAFFVLTLPEIVGGWVRTGLPLFMAGAVMVVVSGVLLLVASGYIHGGRAIETGAPRRRCPSCGMPLAPPYGYCPSCGQPVEKPA